MPNTMPLKPRMSEKSYGMSHVENTFTFDVPITANKVEVKHAIEAQFSVRVDDVRILRSKGKQARSIRIGGTRKMVSGKRPDIKKAYVKLAEGNSIPIFAKIDEETKKQEKMEEKIAKKADKEEQKTTAKTSKLPFRRKKKGEEE
ncbi:50S ribosomal protein L23 [Candidatus Parcubacteria bacterium]|nr:50S ribosomal protein L23 [Candidatus Parcubacteria bacterium]